MRAGLQSNAMSSAARPASPFSATGSARSPADEPQRVATSWLAQLKMRGSAPMLVPPPERPAETLAALVTIALNGGQTLLILIPDDEPLPELSNALDLTARPLCLVLPSADFAARIAMRATVSLLKSRLARHADDVDNSQDVGWRQQRERIAEQPELWQQVQAWTASNDRGPWPVSIAQLFPVRVLPIAAYRSLPPQTADLTVLYRCGPLPEATLFGAQQLQIGQRDATPTHHALTLADEATRLRTELAQLTQDVGEMELELATAQAELADFTRRYYEQIGRRMTLLDTLEARLAEALAAQSPFDPVINQQAETLRDQARTSQQEQRRFTDAERAPSQHRNFVRIKKSNVFFAS